MIYSNVYFDTKVDGNFFDKKWNITYTIVQGRVNLTGIKDERSLVFKIISNQSYDLAYRDLMLEAVNELAQYNFDLFNIPVDEFVKMKERLEDGKVKNNQITQD
jgi:hypothetical protein